MTGQGLPLGFGGVLTSSPHARMAWFCAKSGLPADAVTGPLTRTEEVRPVTAQADAGLIPGRQRKPMRPGTAGRRPPGSRGGHA